MNTGIKRDPINPDEEKIIFQQFGVHGNKWSRIAEFLPGRTDNNVKNHFYSTLRRKIRKINKILKRKFPNEEVRKCNAVTLPVEYKKTFEEIYKMIKNKELTY